MTFTTRGAPEVRTGAAGLIGPGAANLGGTRRSERTLDGVVDRVRHDEPLRKPHRDALGRRRRVTGRRRRPGRRPHRGRDLPLPPRRGERHRDDRGRRRSASARTALPPSRPLERDSITPTSARVSGRVDPRGRGTVAWFEYGTTTRLGNRTARHQRRLRARRLDPAVDDRRPPAGDAPTTTASSREATPARRTGRSGASGRAQGRSRRPAPRTPLRALRHPHGNRRPRRSRDELPGSSSGRRPRTARGRSPSRWARAAALSPSPRRWPASHRAPSTTCASSPRARRGTTYGADVVVPDGGPPDRRAHERVRDLARACADPRGRRLRRARDPGLGRVRPRRRADGPHGRCPASRLELDDVRLVPAHRARARPPVRLPRRRRERSRHGDRGDVDVRHRRPSARRPWTAPPVHDRRHERAGPARRDRAARRHLRPRRRRHADRPREGRHPRGRPRQRLPPARAAAATACSAAPATTYVAARDGAADVVLGGPGRDRGRLDRRRDVGLSVSKSLSGHGRVPGSLAFPSVAVAAEQFERLRTGGLAEHDPDVAALLGARARPPARPDRADRLRELHLAGDPRGRRLGADEQVRGGLPRPPLLRRLRDRRRDRAARDRPCEGPVRRRPRERPAARGRAGEHGRLPRPPRARRHRALAPPRPRRPPDARAEGQLLRAAVHDRPLRGLPRDGCRGRGGGARARGRAPAEARALRRVGVSPHGRHGHVPSRRRRGRRAPLVRHGALRRARRRRAPPEPGRALRRRHLDDPQDARRAALRA